MNLRSLPIKTGCMALLLASAIAARPLPAPGFHRHGGYLGVVFENLTDYQRLKYQVPAKQGVGIAAVDRDAPAGKAGLAVNDVIVRMNGKVASNAEDLRDQVRKMDPGQRILLDILRDGHPLRSSIILADRRTIQSEAWRDHYTVPDPNSGPDPAPESDEDDAGGGLRSYIPGALPYTGLVFDVLNPQLARYFGLRNSTGLLVKSIAPESPGSRAALHAGDVICRANDIPMTSRSRWNRLLRENRHEAIKLHILRNRQPMALLLTLPASKS